MDLTAGTALVTGASSGIGRHFALQLAHRGAHLVLVARHQHTLDALAAEISAMHPASRVHVIPTDLSVASAGADLAGAVSTLGTQVDVLINVASTAAFQPVPTMAVYGAPRRSCSRSPRRCGARPAAVACGS